MVPVKIAIVSDLHLGYERFYDDAYSQAREALETANKMADVILIPGDIFDKRSPPPEVIAQGINIFRDIKNSLQSSARVSEFKSAGESKIYTDIPIIAIPGTHERTSAGRENAVQLLSLAGLLVDTSEATTVVKKGEARVAVFGMGGLSEERLKDKLKELSPSPIAGAFNIFMMHQSTYELLPFSSEFIHNEELPRGFDLYVNGHIHSTVISEIHGKKFLIPGSTVLTQLKEGEQGRKGFLMFDTDTGKHNFVEIGARPFIAKKIEPDLTDSSLVLGECERVIDAIISKEKTKPIIRMILKGKLPGGVSASDLHLGSLQKTYSEKAYLEVDLSDLVDASVEKEMGDLREEKIEEIPISQLGLSFLLAKLKENGFDKSPIQPTELFNILGSDMQKEKAVKKALELIFEGEAKIT